METFGERLKAKRLAAGMSQDRLAELIGSDRSHIIRIESGKILRPKPETVQRLAKALGIEFSDLRYGVTVSQGTSIEETPNYFDAHAEDDELIGYFRQLSTDDRVRLIAIARTFYQLQKG